MEGTFKEDEQGARPQIQKIILFGRNSQLSVHNKLLLYKQVLKPIWTMASSSGGVKPQAT
jgi:hypothetical protein